jgi:hypothetical protein
MRPRYSTEHMFDVTGSPAGPDETEQGVDGWI